MSWFPVNLCVNGVVGAWCNLGVQNGVESSVPGSSIVNCMLGYCELSSCVLCSALWITRVSSTNLTQRCGGCEVLLRALTSNFSMNRLAIRGLRGNPWLHHGHVHNTYPGEVGVFKAELQKCDNLWYGHLGPLWQCGVLCESLFDNFDWSVHWNWSK